MNILAKGNKKSRLPKENSDLKGRMNHEEQIPCDTTRRRKKTKCNCTTTTQIDVNPMPFFSIHSRKKRKPKTRICP